MRIREKPLDTWVIMRPDGSVDSAHCTCMAGLDECCSHVAAVLFTLESATKARSEASVTDAPAYWMCPTGARLDVPYKRLKDMDLQSAAKKRKSILTDLVSEQSKNDLEETNFLDIIPSPTKQEEDQFLEELNRCLPSSAVLSLSDKFSENFIPKTQLNTWPVDLGKLYSKTNETLTYEDLMKKCEQTNISVSDPEIKFLESQTKKQSDSSFWFKYRIGRVTASNFYAVCHTNPEKPSMSLVKKLCNSEEYRKIFTCSATEWGKRKEEIARKDYVAKMSISHQNFQCSESGLILSEEYPQFGASPDGLTTCECCGDGCLEIKCPYSCKDSVSIEVAWLDVYGDGTVSLKKKHPYYYQVQMSLFISNRQHCDFFVWNPYGNHLVRIYRDNDLWTEMSLKAQTFHMKCMMPELLSRYHTRKQVLQPVLSAIPNTSVAASQDKVVKYCVCGGNDDGRKMIMCEEENCPKQWYHMVCINLKRAPKGRWFCKECRKLAKK